MKIYKISLAVLALLIIGTSIAGAFPGQTSACDNCHTISPSIIVSADVTSTLTVNPGQAFTVGITYSGGLSTGETEVNWPIVLDNPLFNASPRIPVPASAASNGTTSSVLTAPATPGLYTTRVYASSGTGTTPDGSNFSDISVMVQTPSIPNNINLDVDMPVRTTFIGINATYILTLNNSGTVMDNYTLTVDNPDGATIASLSTDVVQNLAPGANTTVFLNVTNAVQGKFRVNVTGTSMGDSTRMASVNTTTIVNAQAAMTWHVRAGGQTEDMAIQGMAFYPGIIIVNAGDTIMWEIGNFHTISFLSGQAPPPGGSPESLIPSGDLEYNGTGFVSSGILPTGGNYSLKFTEPGIFSYMCLIHPGMQGIVIVQPSGSKYPFTQEEYNNRSEMDMQKDIDVGKDLVDKAKLMVTSSPGPDNTTMWKTFIDIPLPEMVDVNLEQINSSANGNATLNIINPTDLNVMINVTGLEPDSNNTANIKIGTCDFPGSTVFSLGNITADSDGKGSFVTDISVLPGFGIMNRGWIVDIENETQPVACGNVIKHDAAYMRFVPSNLTINQGDNVEWTQLNPMEIHTVSFPEKGQTPPEFLLPGYLINPEAALPSGVDGYNGTGYYNSGILTPGASYNLTFTKPGTYDYLCLIHDEMGMIGKVIVLPPEEQTKFEQINLVSDVPNLAGITDPNLVNPWGMARSPTSPWWIADNGMGVSTVYNETGIPFPPNNPLVVTVPPPKDGTPPSTPTGIVFNGASDFEVAPGKPARFIFVTEDGTISGWNSSANSTSAILKVDNSPNAVYKGVTIAQKDNASFLYVTNFSGGRVDVFDTDFNPVELAANAFTDKNIPDGFAPFNVQNIKGKIFVTFAEQDAQKHDNLDGPGLGFVDVFDTSGNLLMSLEHGNWMNAPWGIVLAPSDFGSFSEELLVGNFGSGQIAAFDPENGNFHDTLRNISGEEITIEGLWGLGFGNGANAGPNNTLFFTAGINDETHGIFGTFLPAPELAGSISGMKFNDSNGNGMKDIGESGLSNWTIMLKNSTGSIVDMMMTDSEGNYAFEGLVAGNYSVEEVIQADWMQTFPSTGSYFVNITNGENVKDKDFGNIMKVTSINLVENPGFESGTSPWVFYTNGLGSFGVISPGFEGNNAAEVALNSSGTNIQLYQKGIMLEPNTHYRLSFAAYSTYGKDLKVLLIKHVSPYTEYGLDQKFNLSKDWQEFSTEFTTTGFTGTVNDGRLMFWLAPFATAGDKYYIDNVRLEKVTGTLSVTTTPVSGDIFVDSVLKGTGSWSGPVSAGSHSVSFGSVSGYIVPSMQTVEVKEGLITTVTGTYIITTATNLINNPGFESGAASWKFYTSGTGTFTPAPPSFEGSKSANIVLYTGGNNIQLYQKGIMLEPNTHYRLSFAAYSTYGKDLKVLLIKHVSPYTEYGLDQKFNLSRDWQEFSAEFTTTGFTGTVNDGRLMFWLAPFAAAGDKYYIDNVRLEEVQ